MLVNKFSFFLIMMFVCKISYAQINTNSSLKERFPFYDNFLDDRNGWPIQSGRGYDFSFKEHRYDMNNEAIDMANPGVSTIFDHNGDYSITCVLTHISGAEDSGYGLAFSYQRNGSYYEFSIASEGLYKVNRIQSGAVTQIIKWTLSTAINVGQGQPNRLKIWKKGDICELYINDILVNSFRGFENEGDYTGFCVEKNQRVQASLLVIQRY